MLWILDTDHISLFQRGNLTVIRNIQARSPSDLAVTVVSYEEQVRGWLAVVGRSFNNLEQQTFAYGKLNENLDFYRTRTVLDFNSSAATEFQNLIRQKVRIGTQDLKISAITLSLHATLVTRNRQDFQKVPGLCFEDWSIE
jgi:tRNA(fMet)-specific endonuclease VapC